MLKEISDVQRFKSGTSTHVPSAKQKPPKHSPAEWRAIHALRPSAAPLQSISARSALSDTSQISCLPTVLTILEDSKRQHSNASNLSCITQRHNEKLRQLMCVCSEEDLHRLPPEHGHEHEESLLTLMEEVGESPPMSHKLPTRSGPPSVKPIVWKRTIQDRIQTFRDNPQELRKLSRSLQQDSMERSAKLLPEAGAHQCCRQKS
eukprot:NODE_4223_length_822_cov_35.679137_g4065_i0.p1 GENE.NODE_4223_length_822_cov_35.679137_g4065_i0~~NODE_4223_length_822_cov_35.679137_g4065_i0.p1  ORF type:complete len:205 (-),score=47.86 NODE_4223_length_822_cov_35.679137_g4065_i0:181-795(-)